jgi:tape measure domain-containing protein
MATDLERLVVQLSADFRGFEREMQRANGVAMRQARAIETTFTKAGRRLDDVGRSMASSLVTPLAGIAAAVSAREVLQYADAWTQAKNALAVAGVTGSQQVVILNELFKSAQANGAPIQALTTLYGRAAQVSVELGASQADLLNFTNGVAVALRVAGTDATTASGALLQLGQALGSANVRAEEFNSIQEGARPILQAVAAGLEEAGGSVAKLKKLVDDGKVTNRQFFDSFLKGLPVIQAMANNASQTISQAYTKITNALTRYIGESDEGLGATKRLVAGLNGLADNFNQTADIVLKVAAVIAGALVGRAIGGMIASLGFSTAALIRFVAALRAAQTAATLGAAFSGIAAAAGPIGLLIGTVVVGALTLFSTSTVQASQGAKLYADALRQVQAEAQKTTPAVGELTGRLQEQQKLFLTQALRAAQDDYQATRGAIEAAIGPLDQLMTRLRDGSAIKAQMQGLKDLRDGLRDGAISADQAKERLAALANANPGQFEALANQLIPLINKLGEASKAAEQLRLQLAGVGAPAAGPSFRSSEVKSLEAMESMKRTGDDLRRNMEDRNKLSKTELELTDKIAEIRKKATEKGGYIPLDEAKKLAQDTITAEAARTEKKGGGPTRQKRTTDDSFNRELQQIKDRTAALALEADVVGRTVSEQESRKMALELEQQALRKLQDTARQNGDINWRTLQLTDEQKAKIKEVSQAYGDQVAALQRVQEAQQRATAAVDEFYSTSKSELIDAILGAKTFEQALANIGKKLASLALNSVFDSLFKPTGGGGILSSLASLFTGKATGGWISGPGTGTSDSVPIRASAGEFMVRASAARKHGALLEAINSGKAIGQGLAEGGYVMPRAPTIPAAITQPRAAPGGGAFTYAPVVDARGAQAGVADQIAGALQENNKQFMEFLKRNLGVMTPASAHAYGSRR